MRKPHLALVAPRPDNGTIGANRPPIRRPNRELRDREYLLPAEVEKLIAAAGDNRFGHRDATMILAAYRHGLRVSELVMLKWENVDFNRSHLHFKRYKTNTETVHPIPGRELRALRRLQREQDPKSTYVFTSMRDVPFTPAGFRKMVARLGVAAGFDYLVHPHMLRHACGYKLANDGVDTISLAAYLGHKNIQNTQRYAALSPTRFKDFWRD